MDLEAFDALRSAEGTRVLAAVAERGVDERSLLGTLTALRAEHDADLVSAALSQVRLRDRARAKFGADAEAMFFTPDGVEQATRAAVATHRAARFAGALPALPSGGPAGDLAGGAAGGSRVLDLCCGIGGDLIALARAGLTVHGVDRDPLTVAVAAANIAALGLGDRASVSVGDALAADPAGWPAVFVDPARRTTGRRGGSRRVFDPRGYSPPFAFIPELAAAVPLTGAKVAPGIPHELVPPGAEAEWVSVAGEVKEAALWFGPLATATRRATVLGPAGPATLVDSGLGAPPVGPPGEWLYEPDGAVIRAGLVAEVVAAVPGARLLDPTIAYLTADTCLSSPFVRGYRVTDVLPFSLKRLRELLRGRGVGQVTVKKRGSAVDPDLLRRELRLSGDGHAIVVLTRVAGAPTALLCTP